MQRKCSGISHWQTATSVLQHNHTVRRGIHFLHRQNWWCKIKFEHAPVPRDRYTIAMLWWAITDKAWLGMLIQRSNAHHLGWGYVWHRRPSFLCFVWLLYLRTNEQPPTPTLCIIQLFSLWCHFQQCPWDLRSAPSEGVGQGKVGGFQHWAKVTDIAASGLSCRKPLIGTRWAISLLFCTNGLTKWSSGHVGPPFLAV